MADLRHFDVTPEVLAAMLIDEALDERGEPASLVLPEDQAESVRERLCAMLDAAIALVGEPSALDVMIVSRPEDNGLALVSCEIPAGPG